MTLVARLRGSPEGQKLSEVVGNQKKGRKTSHPDFLASFEGLFLLESDLRIGKQEKNLPGGFRFSLRL